MLRQGLFGYVLPAQIVWSDCQLCPSTLRNEIHITVQCFCIFKSQQGFLKLLEPIDTLDALCGIKEEGPRLMWTGP